jgi:hypothetical protein
MPAGTEMSGEPVEVTRARFKPSPIATLFVGESAPVGGGFFYRGNTGMAREMRRAVQTAWGPTTGDFLLRFKSFCWYLDDLVLEPVNHLRKAERRAMCRDAQPSLAARISEYQPQAIVVLLKRIERDVAAAAASGNYAGPFHCVPFPGFGQQGNFQREMACIMIGLPRAG